MRKALKIVEPLYRGTESFRTIRGVVHRASAGIKTQNPRSSGISEMQLKVTSSPSFFIPRPAIKLNPTLPNHQTRQLSSKPDIPKNLELVIILLEKESRFDLFKELLLMDSKDVPPLFFADHTFSVMDLYILLKSNPIADEVREVLEKARDSNDKALIDKALKWYSGTVNSKRVTDSYDVNIKLFQSMTSGQYLGRTLEDFVRSYPLLTSPHTAILIETFIARACCDLYSSRDVEGKISKLMSESDAYNNPKAKKIKDIVQMSIHGTSLYLVIILQIYGPW